MWWSGLIGLGGWSECWGTCLKGYLNLSQLLSNAWRPKNTISVRYCCKRGRKHCENTFSLHTSMFPLPDQEEVLHRKALNRNAQSVHKFINIFRTSRNIDNGPCSIGFRWGTLCFSLDYEVYATIISQESKHCFRDKWKYKYTDKEPKLGNEHFGPLGSTYHNQCLLTYDNLHGLTAPEVSLMQRPSKSPTS